MFVFTAVAFVALQVNAQHGSTRGYGSGDYGSGDYGLGIGVTGMCCPSKRISGHRDGRKNGVYDLYQDLYWSEEWSSETWTSEEWTSEEWTFEFVELDGYGSGKKARGKKGPHSHRA